MVSDWQQGISDFSQRRQAFVMVTIIGVEGSAPRDSGTKMLVHAGGQIGTIGGGNLERVCTEKAEALLQAPSNQQMVDYFPLSAKFNQCCSGAVSVLFESFVELQAEVTIFGAGHVAKELIRILPRLNASVLLVDQRIDQFPSHTVPDVVFRHCSQPIDEVSLLVDDSVVLIMTHDHQLDFELCSAILKLKKVRFLGLIGSVAKAGKFRKRLIDSGIPQADVDLLVSPIGLSSVAGKRPMEVAVSVCAQLVPVLNQNDSSSDDQPRKQGVGLKDALKLKQNLSPDTSKSNTKTTSHHSEDN